MTSPSPLSGRRFEDRLAELREGTQDDRWADYILFLSPSRSKLVEEVIRAARTEDEYRQGRLKVLTEGMSPELIAKYLDTPLHLSIVALDASLDSGGGGE